MVKRSHIAGHTKKERPYPPEHNPMAFGAGEGSNEDNRVLG